MIADQFRSNITQPDLIDPIGASAGLDSPASAQPHFKLKRFWLKIHLYLGLFGGGLFVLMSLTGSFLVFYKAIDEWLNPALVTTNGESSYRPLNEIVAVARTAGPSDGVLDSVEWPSHPRGVFLTWHKVPADTVGGFSWFQVAIDPYTAVVLTKDREWGGYLVSFIYKLHASLLMDDVGAAILGFVAIALLVSIITGLYLWWPRPGRLRQALTFTSARSPIRRQYEWHKLSGFYSAIILGMLAFTGLYLEFSDYVVPIVRLFSPVQEFPEEETLQSIPIAGTLPLSVEEAIALTGRVFPEGELRSISIPHGDTDVYQISLRQPGEVMESSGQSQVWLDQYSGKILRVHDWRQFTGGETFLAWLFPLHNGEAFGLAGRWIVFFIGFVPLVLYVTALRMWWLKRQAHRRQSAYDPEHYHRLPLLPD
ncbi:MAG: PepSY-associated TM helix domain-containing protein [Nitrospira sp.]|nr:PepSY-associated TM helix domain-containing protein [Nitrospira sp.]